MANPSQPLLRDEHETESGYCHRAVMRPVPCRPGRPECRRRQAFIWTVPLRGLSWRRCQKTRWQLGFGPGWHEYRRHFHEDQEIRGKQVPRAGVAGLWRAAEHHPDQDDFRLLGHLAQTRERGRRFPEAPVGRFRRIWIISARFRSSRSSGLGVTSAGRCAASRCLESGNRLDRMVKLPAPRGIVRSKEVHSDQSAMR